MKTKYILLISTSILLGSCGENRQSKTPMGVESNTNSIQLATEEQAKIDMDEKKQIEQVALSFHRWNIECILKETGSIAYDFEIIKDANDKCKLDSTQYFKNLRKLGTISEKFIQLEWQRVEKCSNFLKELDWKTYNSADAYEYQEFCDIYFYYWTRTQEPFHGVEVKRSKKIDDYYMVTLVFYYNYGNKEYVEYSMPLVKVETENGDWKITEISWLEK